MHPLARPLPILEFRLNPPDETLKTTQYIGPSLPTLVATISGYQRILVNLLHFGRHSKRYIRFVGRIGVFFEALSFAIVLDICPLYTNSSP